jgi:tetratricopeptide (TPR) repeat protein
MLSFTLLLLLGSVPAEETGALAAKHFAAGEAAFKRADYTAAALAFERAYGLAPRAAALLNAAEAWEKSGMRAKAYADCRRALSTEGILEAEAAEAERRMARFRPKIGLVEVSGPAGVESDVDAGGDRQALPTVFVVEPGQRAIILYAQSGGRLEERVITVAAGATVQVAFEVPATPDPLPEVPPPTALAPPVPSPETEPAAPVVGQGPPLLSWVACGGAGVGLIAAGIFGALSLDAKAAYESAPSRERADAFFDRRTGANVCIGLAVAAAVSGAALWWFDD